MNKIIDVIIGLLLKKGVFTEMKDFSANVDVPQEGDRLPISIYISATNLQIKVMSQDEKAIKGPPNPSRVKEKSYEENNYNSN